MAVLKFGHYMPSVYFDVFTPDFNVTTRVGFTAYDPIAIQTHFVDKEQFDMKGSYQCTGGICCEALGNPMQSYVFPVVVWNSVDDPNKGFTFKMWRMNSAIYKQIVTACSGADGSHPEWLMQSDIIVSRTKQGQGSRTSVTFCGGSDAYRSAFLLRLPEEKQQEIKDATMRFYQTAEQNMTHPMTENDWEKCLALFGYDVQNHAWPQGFNPMSIRQSSGVISNNLQNSRPGYGVGQYQPPQQFQQYQQPQLQPGYGVGQYQPPQSANQQYIPPVQQVVQTIQPQVSPVSQQQYVPPVQPVQQVVRPVSSVQQAARPVSPVQPVGVRPPVAPVSPVQQVSKVTPVQPVAAPNSSEPRQMTVDDLTDEPVNDSELMSLLDDDEPQQGK